MTTPSTPPPAGTGTGGPLPVGASADAGPLEDDVPEQMRVRREKRDRLLAEGREPYPVGVPVTTTVAEVRARHAELAPGEETDDVVGVAGRVVYQRNTGKLFFVTLQGGDGSRVQAMLS
ncbi:MAG: Lysyl-tRNA synthetase, partial [Actinotalea sp.]|nr:Lysyl-tRNA synthetase [Actinotalea sp.]